MNKKVTVGAIGVAAMLTAHQPAHAQVYQDLRGQLMGLQVKWPNLTRSNRSMRTASSLPDEASEQPRFDGLEQGRDIAIANSAQVRHQVE